MKKLTCEMCGSTDIIKQDGVFVCQTCGCKYSVEEAKKMMIEGTVEVTGTICVDNSERLHNLYQIARRARDENNSENAAKYYDMILVEDPTSWEASFYVVYFKAASCKIAQIRSAAISVSNCIGSVLHLIHDHIADNYAQEKALSEISARCTAISSALYDGAQKHYNNIAPDIRSQYTQEWLDNACAARDILYTLGDQIEEVFGPADNVACHQMSVSAWKQGIEKHRLLLPHLHARDTNKKIIDSYVDKVGAYDADYRAAHEEKKREKRRRAIKKEIAAIDEEIAVLPTDRRQDNSFSIAVIVVALVFGVFVISATIIRALFFGAAVDGLAIFIGLFFIIIAILGTKPISKRQANKNIERVKELEEKKTSLQAEYSALERQDI